MYNTVSILTDLDEIYLKLFRINTLIHNNNSILNMYLNTFQKVLRILNNKFKKKA